MVVEVSQIYLM
ncbi:putative membrane protein, partial [Yersinia pestis PY-103]